MINFADSGGEITVVFEELRKRYDVGKYFANGNAIAINARCIGPQAAEKGGAAGVAKRKLAVGAVEADAACGQFVDVGGFDERMIVTAKGDVEVIDGNKKDVGFGGGFFCPEE